VWEIAQLLGVGRSTVYRTLGENPAAVPNVDLADCDEISGDLVAPGSLPPHLTIADLERAGMAAKALDNPQVMRRAWE
jgi:hypothetical protein